MRSLNAAACSTYTRVSITSTADALVVASRVTAATNSHSLHEVADILDRTLGDTVDDITFAEIVDTLAETCHGCGMQICGCNIVAA